MQRITFSFELDKRYIKHLKDQSVYNYNYYELDFNYGDYIIERKCNILLEEAEDDSWGAYYTLGYFDENDKFQAMFTWYEDTAMDFKE